jgi:hypothetical protein
VPYFETSAKESTNVDLAFMSMVEGVINSTGPHFGAGAGVGRTHGSAAGTAGGTAAGVAMGGAHVARPQPTPVSSSGHPHPPVNPTEGRTTIGEKAGKLKKGMYETLRSAAGGGSTSSKEGKSGASSFGPSFKGRSSNGHPGEEREKCCVS